MCKVPIVIVSWSSVPACILKKKKNKKRSRKQKKTKKKTKGKYINSPRSLFFSNDFILFFNSLPPRGILRSSSKSGPNSEIKCGEGRI
jgi:hypothetical protein